MFFRHALLSGFEWVFGDHFDGVIQVALLEHWFNVFRGVSRWSETLAFYPVRAGLGYNDAYLLYGIAYAPLRAMGLDPFLAAELVNVAVKLAGFVGFVLFARRALELDTWLAALGAAAFTVSNGSYVQGTHVQLFSVAFAPLLSCLLLETTAAVAARQRWRTVAWGSAAGLLFSAWLLTSFYMAWFYAVFCLLWASVLAGLAGLRRTRGFLLACRDNWLALAVGVAAASVVLVPFLRLYLPKASESGMHGFHETVQYLPGPSDALNLGGDSLFYGTLPALLGIHSSNQELATGFTPLLLVAFCAGAAAAWRGRADDEARLPAAMAAAACLFWLAAVQVGGHTPWRLVYDWVPGAQAIRVVSRLQLFLAWPVTTVAMLGLAEVGRMVSGRPRGAVARANVAAYVAVAACGALLFAEQFNKEQTPVLYRSVQLDWLRAVPPPPAACEAFFVSAARLPGPGEARTWVTDMVGHGIDAMLLAEVEGRPTVNGFASKLPAGWDLLWISRPDYAARVREWADRHRLTPGLCGLDLRAGAWNTDPFER